MTLSRRRDPPPWLPPLSRALAEALPRLSGQPPDPALLELIEALTLALERGDLAIDLNGPAPPGIRSAGWPALHSGLLAASAIGREPHGPLALEGQWLGWRRWLQLRSEVLAALVARAGRIQPAQAAAPAQPSGDGLDPLQQRAIRIALERDLLVLAGGPGTGKTSTVAHLLQAVAERQEGAVIQLAAPTGKAAARLRQATAGRWPCGTLHQLLESRGDGAFRRHRQRPLSLDLLVVDEVSMVDLALMEALLEALPERARLVLVGDPAQLPPVAPGAPLRELLRGEGQPALAETVVTLRTIFRNDGAIATMAAALRRWIEEESGMPMEPIDRLRPLLSRLPADANLRWWQAAPGPLPVSVRQALMEHLRRLGAAAAACIPGADQGWRELFAIRDELLLLTPRHQGPWGVHAVHRALLGDASAAALGQWPSGTPVLCTRNLHGLGLSNGDLGVLVAGAERWLLFGQEQPIWVHPAQLSGALEPALALTVHKAQGSESRRVMVLLPGPDPSDPRLLYTALTRARQEAWLFTPPPGAALE
ncbi:MAG: ATP-dependent RecD-like DNA helicase [Cyanobacteriota bacterium]